MSLYLPHKGSATLFDGLRFQIRRETEAEAQTKNEPAEITP
jgi:hypothetical protein